MAENSDDSDRFKERDRINISRGDEMKHWTAKLGCTELELRAAIARVGPLVVDVSRYIKSGSQPPL